MKNLKVIRSVFGLTQQELADNAHLCRTSISHWENYDTVPSDRILHKIADYFNIGIDLLLKPDLTIDEICDLKQKNENTDLLKSVQIIKAYCDITDCGSCVIRDQMNCETDGPEFPCNWNV